METMKLSNGVEIPVLGYGVYQVTPAECERCVSDAISVKRGELVRILNLLKGKRRSGDTATQFHYEDVIMRIQTALGQEIR